MPELYRIAVFVHILCACVWFGGMVFLLGAVLPVTRQAPFDRYRILLIERTGERFRTLGWIVFGLFLATGIIALGARGFTWSDAIDGRLWAGAWGTRLAWKLGLFGTMVAIQAVHDFWLGPRAARLASAVEPASAGPGDRPRLHPSVRAARWLGRLTFLLTLVILWLAVRLVRG